MFRLGEPNLRGAYAGGVLARLLAPLRADRRGRGPVPLDSQLGGKFGVAGAGPFFSRFFFLGGEFKCCLLRFAGICYFGSGMSVSAALANWRKQVARLASRHPFLQRLHGAKSFALLSIGDRRGL